MWNHVYNLIELISIGPAVTALPSESHLHFRLEKVSSRRFVLLVLLAFLGRVPGV